MLTLERVCAGYDGLQVLHDVDLEVAEGQVVALVGANGAGKTTTLRTIAGLVHPTRGDVRIGGRSIVGVPSHRIVRSGVSMVAEDRELFGRLTVRENLDMGAYRRGRDQRGSALDEVHELFPVLAERASQRADTLSGGQQQMLAIGRALMARPKLLLLDEPSLGLAPKLVADVFATVEGIKQMGITVLIVEQNAKRTLELADHAYVLENGQISLDGVGAELLRDERVRQAYLGL